MQALCTPLASAECFAFYPPPIAPLARAASVIPTERSEWSESQIRYTPRVR